ncbi:sigma-70 family RNA polymerase sigma factor [Bacillus salitolerans]|uniref:RNA polymerase sigma factor n=1 Tax=Bacillus salitolerans TaxID=1437434 RepID=A0ABW4LN21_9BACI
MKTQKQKVPDQLVPEQTNEQLLEKVMVQYGEDIKRILYGYTKNWSITDDLTQDTFVTVYLKLDEFRGESSLKTWIYRIAINKAKDYLRSFSYRKFVLADKFSENKRDPRLQPEEELLKNLENRQLLAEIYKLPVKYREVIILFYLKELSIEEISDILEMNSSTIKTRLNRGREKLRKSYVLEGGNINGLKA